VNLVASSRSRIKLRFCVDCTMMFGRLSETLSDEVMGKFLNCVESVCYREVGTLSLSRLANLKKINTYIPLDEENEAFIFVNQLPRNLKKLKIFKEAKFPLFKRFFNGTQLLLASLKIRFSGTPKDMMELLTDLNGSFPNLTNLDVCLILTEMDESLDEAPISAENYGKLFRST